MAAYGVESLGLGTEESYYSGIVADPAVYTAGDAAG